LGLRPAAQSRVTSARGGAYIDRHQKIIKVAPHRFPAPRIGEDTLMQTKERARLKKLIARNNKQLPSDEPWRADMRAARKSSEQLILAQEGMKGGKRAFATLLAKSAAQAEAHAARQRQASAAASRKRIPQQKTMLANRLKALQSIGGLGVLGDNTQRFLLQTPFEISLIGASLTEHRIVTGASFARFGFTFGSNRTQTPRMHFSYVWQNPTDKFALINAHGYIIFDGHIEVGVNGGFWPGDRRASIAVQAFMTLSDFGQEPLLPSAQTFTQTAASLSESDGGFGAVGAIAAKDVFRGHDLDHSLYIVKPGGTVGLVIAAIFPFGTGQDGGRVVADFAEGAHRVTSPGVLVQLVS
jgi:hypothetical protein